MNDVFWPHTFRVVGAVLEALLGCVYLLASAVIFLISTSYMSYMVRIASEIPLRDKLSEMSGQTNDAGWLSRFRKVSIAPIKTLLSHSWFRASALLSNQAFTAIAEQFIRWSQWQGINEYGWRP